MKKVLLTAFAVMASLSLFAQGTVTYANNSSTKVLLDKGDGSAIVNAGSPYVVGLWYGAAGSTADQLTYVGDTSKKSLANGGFLGGTLNLPSAGTYTLQLRGWDGSKGDYAASKAAGVWGDSALWTQGTGNPTASPSVPPVSIVAAGNFSGMTIHIVPEPSTIALGILGLGGLFLLRRRS